MKFPYYINPDIDALKDAEGDERLRLIRHIAACVGDEATLRILLGIDPEEFAHFYPDMMPSTLSTEDTINSFIRRFSSEEKAEVTEIEEIVTPPAIDYASMLDDEPTEELPTPEDATSDAISSFLNAVPPQKIKRKTAKKPENSSAETPMHTITEPSNHNIQYLEDSLKLMVKNKNYDKALEIINELSLKNPKKSVYFAYQMRFIKKLIKNESAGKTIKP